MIYQDRIINKATLFVLALSIILVLFILLFSNTNLQSAYAEEVLVQASVDSGPFSIRDGAWYTIYIKPVTSEPKISLLFRPADEDRFKKFFIPQQESVEIDHYIELKDYVEANPEKATKIISNGENSWSFTIMIHMNGDLILKINDVIERYISINKIDYEAPLIKSNEVDFEIDTTTVGRIYKYTMPVEDMHSKAGDVISGVKEVAIYYSDNLVKEDDSKLMYRILNIGSSYESIVNETAIYINELANMNKIIAAPIESPQKVHKAMFSIEKNGNYYAKVVDSVGNINIYFLFKFSKEADANFFVTIEYGTSGNEQTISAKPIFDEYIKLLETNKAKMLDGVYEDYFNFYNEQIAAFEIGYAYNNEEKLNAYNQMSRKHADLKNIISSPEIRYFINGKIQDKSSKVSFNINSRLEEEFKIGESIDVRIEYNKISIKDFNNLSTEKTKINQAYKLNISIYNNEKKVLLKEGKVQLDFIFANEIDSFLCVPKFSNILKTDYDTNVFSAVVDANNAIYFGFYDYEHANMINKIIIGTSVGGGLLLIIAFVFLLLILKKKNLKKNEKMSNQETN